MSFYLLLLVAVGMLNKNSWSSAGRSFVMRSLNLCPENFSQNLVDWGNLLKGGGVIYYMKFIQSLNRDEDFQLLALLHGFANHKLQNIKHNFLTYHHMTDLYNKMVHDC